jgi:hypothetical protein
MKLKPFIAMMVGLSLSGFLIARSYPSEGLSLKNSENALTPPKSSRMSHPEMDPAFENLVEDDATRWYLADSQKKTSGVALVIHGLNLRPDRMEPIISQLGQAGIDALNVSLRGHGENFDHRQGIDSAKARLETFKAVSYPLWTNEAYCAYLQAEKSGFLFFSSGFLWEA